MLSLIQLGLDAFNSIAGHILAADELKTPAALEARGVELVRCKLGKQTLIMTKDLHAALKQKGVWEVLGQSAKWGDADDARWW